MNGPGNSFHQMQAAPNPCWLVFATAVVFLTGSRALPASQNAGLRRVVGVEQEGLQPVVYIRAEDATCEGSVMGEVITAQSNVWWIKLAGQATCRIALRGMHGEITGSIQEPADGTNSIPEVIQIAGTYKGSPVAYIKSERWLRVHSPGAEDIPSEIWVQNFQIKNIRLLEQNLGGGYVTFQLMLYRANAGETSARLIKFKPVEIQLPPLQPSAPARLALPASAPHPVDPNWANPDRVAALANLPVPTARWIPWVLWGVALASLLAVGTLLHRRRKRGTPPP